MKNSITILAIKRGELIHTTIQNDFVVEDEDIMVIMGTNDKLDYIC